MSWDQIIGHSSARERFQKSVARGRLASTYLLVGPEGIGKRTFALKLAEAILCEENPLEKLDPCGVCSGCVQVQQESHPDLIQIRKPADKSVLPVDLLIGRKERRRREGLVYEIGLKPFRGGYRIAIIDDADYFNAESANSLLKTLEEPPPNTLLLLLGTSEQRQLQTIVSRSQLVRFAALTQDEVQQVLTLHQLIDESEAGRDVSTLASLAGGSVKRAMELAGPDTFEFRQQLRRQLASGDPHQGQFAKRVAEFAEASGKEGYRRRPRLILVADLAMELIAETLHSLVEDGQPTFADEFPAQLAQRFASNPAAGAERLDHVLTRTHQMQHHVLANAGAPNLLDSWLIDLGRILRGETVDTGRQLTGVV